MGDRAEAGGFVEESLECGAAVFELGFVGDGAGEFYGEAEVGRCGGGPALPGFAHVRAVEAGVDFDAVEAVGVALEVGEFCFAGRRKGVRVVFGEGPPAVPMWMLLSGGELGGVDFMRKREHGRRLKDKTHLTECRNLR